MKILLIDDSKIQRRYITRAIRESGYLGDILEAGNGKEGYEKYLAEASEVKIIFCDWNMPMMNGLEFLQAISKIDVSKGVSVFMVTTEQTKNRIMQAKEAFPSLRGYIAKPFGVEELKVVLIPVLREMGIN